ncbi:hypothetical protein PROFUN_10411 [Planoprotostelium fungivorum]|uniref:Uncharacterized protein n=1 Tax=Planoprotostelium fungivorum TaxID=1890364 RepID=A0A2P6NE47_9EUKA|nr:hypothetical protein PROFUN_10411 [Planoprotostelium fungivorum]
MLRLLSRRTPISFQSDTQCLHLRHNPPVPSKLLHRSFFKSKLNTFFQPTPAKPPTQTDLDRRRDAYTDLLSRSMRGRFPPWIDEKTELQRIAVRSALAPQFPFVMSVLYAILVLVQFTIALGFSEVEPEELPDMERWLNTDEQFPTIYSYVPKRMIENGFLEALLAEIISTHKRVVANKIRNKRIKMLDSTVDPDAVRLAKAMEIFFGICDDREVPRYIGEHLVENGMARDLLRILSTEKMDLKPTALKIYTIRQLLRNGKLFDELMSLPTTPLFLERYASFDIKVSIQTDVLGTKEPLSFACSIAPFRWIIRRIFYDNIDRMNMKDYPKILYEKTAARIPYKYDHMMTVHTCKREKMGFLREQLYPLWFLLPSTVQWATLRTIPILLYKEHRGLTWKNRFVVWKSCTLHTLINTSVVYLAVLLIQQPPNILRDFTIDSHGLQWTVDVCIGAAALTWLAKSPRSFYVFPAFILAGNMMAGPLEAKIELEPRKIKP